MSPKRKRLAVGLLLVGLLLVPGPAYAIGLERLDDPDPTRASSGYRATPVDVGNDSLLADRYAAQFAFQPDDLEYRHVREAYDAPNATRDALDRALREGNVTVENATVRADLRTLDGEYPFLTREFDAYYAVRFDDGVLRTERATDADVAAVVREELVVAYADLPAGERETFEKIRNATVHDESYRPWTDEEVPAGQIVTRDGEAYAVEVYSHTDDFGFPDGLFAGIVASGVGIVLSLCGLGLLLVGAVFDG